MHEGQGADDEIDEGCGECVVQALQIQVHQQTHDAATRKRNRIAAMLKQCETTHLPQDFEILSSGQKKETYRCYYNEPVVF